MSGSVLLGLDGSPQSEKAIEWGIHWAKRLDCMLVGLGVVDEPTIRGGQREISRSYQQAYSDLVANETRRTEQILEGFALRCSEANVSFKLLEEVGVPFEKILLQSQRYDLVMLGRQTHFQAGHHDKPCHALEKVIRNAVRPVVSVPDEPPLDQSGGGVLVAYDGSVQAARALQAFLACKLAALGNVHVLAVHKDSVEAAKTADRAVEFLRFHEIDATPMPIAASGSASELFTKKAHQLGVELVVMGAYGQPLITEFFLGSTTRTAMKQARTPLFLYH